MTTDVTKAVEQFRAMQRALEFGCHDGYCVIAKTKGMHTNGGCGCMEDLDFMQRQRVGWMLRAAQIMADHIEASE